MKEIIKITNFDLLKEEINNNNNNNLDNHFIFFEQKTGENQLQTFYNECKQNNNKFALAETFNKLDNISTNKKNYTINPETYEKQKKYLNKILVNGMKNDNIE